MSTKMVDLKVTISEDLHKRLKAVCDFKGKQSHIVRLGILKQVEEEEKRLKQNEAPGTDYVDLIQRKRLVP